MPVALLGPSILSLETARSFTGWFKQRHDKKEWKWDGWWVGYGKDKPKEMAKYLRGSFSTERFVYVSGWNRTKAGWKATITKIVESAP